MSEEEVYKKLKQLRKSRGLTLNDLAENVGLDYQQISRIERGKSRLTIDVLTKMAKALDTPVEQLVKSNSGSGSTSSKSAAAKPLTTQDILMYILEGLEALDKANSLQLAPAKKASLCSLIYSHVNQALQESSDPNRTREIITYSLNLLTAGFKD